MKRRGSRNETLISSFPLSSLKRESSPVPSIPKCPTTALTTSSHCITLYPALAPSNSLPILNNQFMHVGSTPPKPISSTISVSPITVNSNVNKANGLKPNLSTLLHNQQPQFPRRHSTPHFITEIHEDVEESFEPLFQNDATTFIEQLRQAFNSVALHLKKPNVLIMGITGAGKSSLINAIFGRRVAEVGAGIPITDKFTRYEPEGKPIVIYDSKGLEVGSHKDFLNDAEQFLSTHQVTDSGNQEGINIIWYVVNSAGSRFQPFEEKLCKEVFGAYPILFLLNKADISSEEERRILKETIYECGFSNCLGIVEIASNPRSELREIEKCVACGSDEILFNKRKKIALCSKCGNEMSLVIEKGLDKVLEITIQALPLFVREAFISSQNVSFRLKDKMAKQIIMGIDKEFECRRVSKLLEIITKMMTRLSLLWEFKEHASLYGLEIARDYIGDISFVERVLLFFSKERNMQHKSRVLVLGILWNRCVRKLALQLVFGYFQPDIILDDHLLIPKLTRAAFTDLNADLFDYYEQKIEVIGLNNLLEEEMPSEVKK